MKDGNIMEAVSFPPQEKWYHDGYVVHLLGFLEATGWELLLW